MSVLLGVVACLVCGSQGWKAGAKDALSSPASSQKRAKRGRTTADDADDRCFPGDGIGLIGGSLPSSVCFFLMYLYSITIIQ